LFDVIIGMIVDDGLYFGIGEVVCSIGLIVKVLWYYDCVGFLLFVYVDFLIGYCFYDWV